MAETWRGALRAWMKQRLAARLGGAPEVIWADQDQKRPEYPYASLRVGPSLPQQDTPSEKWTTDLAQTGQEVLIDQSGDVERVVSTHLFVPQDPAAGHEGGTEAVEVLEGIVQDLALPSAVERFRGAALGVAGHEAVQNLTGLAGPTTVGQAQLDLRVRAQAGASERTGYIKQTVITSTNLPDFGAGVTFGERP